MRGMLNIVDCKQIDDEVEIEACSVQVTSEMGQRAQTSENTARLERRLLLALLATSPAMGNAVTTEAAASAESCWMGWLAAFVITMIFLTELVTRNFEIRLRRPAPDLVDEVPVIRPSAPPHDIVDQGHENRPERTTRDVLVQGPVTYKTRCRLDGTHGRYTPLAERDFDAWAED